MINIKDYVKGLFDDIPQSKDKESIMEEIILNLEEKVQDLIDAGKSEEDAINKSIVDFGDIGEIKNDLMMASGAEPSKVVVRRNYANRLGFALCGSALLIGLMFFINYTTSWDHPWFVYPTFAILWWPLAMFFSWLNHKDK